MQTSGNMMIILEVESSARWGGNRNVLSQFGLSVMFNLTATKSPVFRLSDWVYTNGSDQSNKLFVEQRIHAHNSEPIVLVRKEKICIEKWKADKLEKRRFDRSPPLPWDVGLVLLERLHNCRPHLKGTPKSSALDKRDL